MLSPPWPRVAASRGAGQPGFQTPRRGSAPGRLQAAGCSVSARCHGGRCQAWGPAALHPLSAPQHPQHLLLTGPHWGPAGLQGLKALLCMWGWGLSQQHCSEFSWSPPWVLRANGPPQPVKRWPLRDQIWYFRIQVLYQVFCIYFLPTCGLPFYSISLSQKRCFKFELSSDYEIFLLYVWIIPLVLYLKTHHQTHGSSRFSPIFLYTF